MWIVTGASGFVGSHVVRELRRVGIDVVGVYRDGTDGRVVPRWEGSVLERALQGATGVVHAASVVHRATTPARDYIEFNVTGTRNLLHAARLAGVRRFVFLSTIKVYGESPRGVIDERTPVAADSDYSQTKVSAERLVMDARDLAPLILRLCPVYGRGDKGNVSTMIRAIWRRAFVIPGTGATKKSIVHASTVADVVRAAAMQTAVGAFVVADRQTPSVLSLATTIARLLGRPPPLAIPAPILLGAAAVIGTVARRLRVSTSISPELVRKAQLSSVCDPSCIERTFGVTCHADLESTLSDEIDWLRRERLL
jgi:UDP-glucose 4-epimerase